MNQRAVRQGPTHQAGNSHSTCLMHMEFYLQGVDYFRRWWPKHKEAVWTPLEGKADEQERRHDEQWMFYLYREIFPWTSPQADIKHFHTGKPKGNPLPIDEVFEREKTLVTRVHGGEYDADELPAY